MNRIYSAAFWLLLSGVFLGVSVCAYGQTPQEADTAKAEQTAFYWDELMHYAVIARWDLAEDNGRNLLGLDPDPVVLLDLAESEKYADSYRNLSLLKQNTPLEGIATEVLKRVEQGRYLRRTDSDRIAVEVKRLSSGTTRGAKMALDRLKDSGEWAVPIMVEALRDPARTDELAVIGWALPKLGRSAINPLVVVLQQCRDLNVRLIAIEALGEIGYQSALPYMREVAESGDSPTELVVAAAEALRAISSDETLVGSPAAVLFERLGQDYYNGLESLEVPANQDYANIWFWQDERGLYFEQVEREAFDELMAYQLDRTERLYEQSDALEGHVDPSCRAASWAIKQVYRRLFDRIAADPRRVLRRRVTVSKPAKLAIALRAHRGWRA